MAITALADKLGISMDQVMAFGDNLNDLHMMQVVGHPVAPENARPEILAIAETVIGHHATWFWSLRYMEKLYESDFLDCAGFRWDPSQFRKKISPLAIEQPSLLHRTKVSRWF